MRFPSPGQCRTAAELRQRLVQLAVGFDLDDAIEAQGPLARPLTVYGHTLPNRYCAHPTEGWDATPDAAPASRETSSCGRTMP